MARTKRTCRSREMAMKGRRKQQQPLGKPVTKAQYLQLIQMAHEERMRRRAEDVVVVEDTDVGSQVNPIYV